MVVARLSWQPNRRNIFCWAVRLRMGGSNDPNPVSRSNGIDAVDAEPVACSIAVRRNGGDNVAQACGAFRWKDRPAVERIIAEFPAAARGAEGRANVLHVLTDDTGFGHAATFGGAAATPTLDSLAATGLRNNRFHTTALCSPARAALLTGHNHRSAALNCHKHSA